jgi:hypothetical protein
LVTDLEADAGGVTTQANHGLIAPGMALNVGKTLLHDPKESGFGVLGQTGEAGLEIQLNGDAAAFAEPLGIFLDGGNEAELVEERRMQEVRKGANLAGHFFKQAAGFGKGMLRTFAKGIRGLHGLGEIQIHGEDTLRETVVKFAPEAAALLILELEQTSGKLVKSFFGLAALGDVGKRTDNHRDGTIWSKLRHSVAPGPKNLS